MKLLECIKMTKKEAALNNRFPSQIFRTSN